VTGIPTLRTRRPRLFVDPDSLPAVRERARTVESDTFDRFRTFCDRQIGTDPDRADHGREAAIAAFVSLVTDDDRYRELARSLLSTSLDHYEACFERREAVDWYAFSRISAIAAYDWLYDQLPSDDRRVLGRRILDAVDAVQPTEERPSFRFENWGGTDGGFYGTPVLQWYTGVALAGTGIDDERAQSMLEDGYERHRELLDFRASHAGDDGGGASATLNYLLQAYPWATFNFFHSYRTAFGTSIVPEYDFPALFPGYVFWNWLPDGQQFGTGDDPHVTNDLPLEEMHVHCSQIVHFYADSHPRKAAFAAWLRERLPRESHYDELRLPFTRFLLTGETGVDPEGPPLDAELPLGRHFEGMGQAYFRSGSGPDDTYAQFTCGGGDTNHKHFDANSFCLYRNGFLALDTGSRPLPGLHRSHYYATTLAHNSVLVRMPGEEFTPHWGRTEPADAETDHPVPNTGGQRHTGGSIVAFESHDRFGYVAGDATPTYHEDKCDLALRQFVFVPPEHVVIFDRVRSVEPDFEKRWVIHTAEEPTLSGTTLTGDRGEERNDGGRLFCRTLFPEDADLTVVGGPGNQFVAAGQNYPIPDPDEVYAPAGTTILNQWPLLGQWRLEVSPGAARRDDYFLHLLRATDQTVETMGNARTITDDNARGVGFSSEGTDWEVTFGLEGDPSGRVLAREDGETVLEETLSDDVEPQSGLFG
jgi:heparin/heparan-sulfate lyase